MNWVAGASLRAPSAGGHSPQELFAPEDLLTGRKADSRI